MEWLGFLGRACASLAVLSSSASGYLPDPLGQRPLTLSENIGISEGSSAVVHRSEWAVFGRGRRAHLPPGSPGAHPALRPTSSPSASQLQVGSKQGIQSGMCLLSLLHHLDHRPHGVSLQSPGSQLGRFFQSRCKLGLSPLTPQ